MLLLFDIDGTLLKGATKEHAEALHAALDAVYGIDSKSVRSGLAPGGRTDGEIARAILLAAGISAANIDERGGEVRAETCRIYAELCTADLSDTVQAGILPLLQWLTGETDAQLSLVTGNFEPVARIKLRHAGIGRFFPAGQGGFGSDSEDRVALPPIARRRAGRDGVSYPRERTIVIGDTPRDIACAHADQLRCVAISTGPFDAAELTDADSLVGNADELREQLERELRP